MLQASDIQLIKDLIWEAFEIREREAQEKASKEKSIPSDPVLLQKMRCNLNQTLIGLEEAMSSQEIRKDPFKLQELENQYKQYEEELNNLSKAIEDDELQQIVDSFDFEKCIKVADDENWMYRDSPITKEDLIKDILECAEDLKDVKSGRMQRGRIVVNKLYDFKEAESWYSVSFIVEHGEAY